ncbi:MAG: Bug family tripartite tricarboxylate transporter substrate binding protein [Gemmatimonas sp.]
MQVKSEAAIAGFAAALGAVAVLASPARGDAVEDFYRGKQVRLVIGTEAGTSYDAYARTLARHMPDNIPGKPTFVPQNMPGAGSLNTYNHLYNIAPRDGTAFGTGHRFVPLMPLLGMPGPKFDPSKFLYIGSINREIDICIARADSGIRSIDDLKTKELMVGTTGAGAELTTFYATLSRMLDAKLKVITGYRSTNDLYLAVQRGEIQGRCGDSYANFLNHFPDVERTKDVDAILQIGVIRDPAIPQVPSLIDLVRDENDRDALRLMLAPSDMGRPYVGPPEVPPDRAAALRAAFDATVKNPNFIAEIRKQTLEVNPLGGAEMEALVSRAYQTPEPIVARARALVNGE